VPSGAPCSLSVFTTGLQSDRQQVQSPSPASDLRFHLLTRQDVRVHGPRSRSRERSGPMPLSSVAAWVAAAKLAAAQDWQWDCFVGYTRASRRSRQGPRIDQARAKEPSNACDSHWPPGDTSHSITWRLHDLGTSSRAPSGLLDVSRLWRQPFSDWKMPVVNRIRRLPSGGVWRG
jgi:hypothetical protein